ncbi:MAG TPA: hypothetical protein VGH28_06085 [Polyangiaceae bacterium]
MNGAPAYSIRFSSDGSRAICFGRPRRHVVDFMFDPGDGSAIRVEHAHRGASSFDPPQPLTNLAGFGFPVVTPDEDTILAGQNGRIYEAHRATPNDAVGVPPEIASAVSTQGCMLCFSRADLDGGVERRIHMTTRSK